MVFDYQLLAEVFECVVVELFPIVRDEDSRDTEAANDVFPDEALDILLSDSGQGFCLDPLSEIVNPYNDELELPYCHGEGSYYVEPPLSEWPWTIHWGKLF